MANFRPDRIKLEKLLTDIDSGKIRLPNFQREFKWKIPQVKKLLDSIQKNHPTGSLLFSEVFPAKPKISYRQFEYTPEASDACESLVLDGQQRLTSCYCVFFNRGKNSYYLDLNKLFEAYTNKREVDFEEMIINKPNKKWPDDELTNNRLPLYFLKDKNTFREKIKSYKDSFRGDVSKQEYLNFLELGLETYLDNLFDYEFPLIILPKELEIDAVCKVFQTINTTGLVLSAFDICVAMFAPQGLDLREKIKNARKESDNVKIALDKDETAILQTIALLAGKVPKKSKLAVDLKKDDIDFWWDKAVLGFDYAIEILDRFGCGCKKDLSLLPYRPILPVIAALHARKEVSKLRLPERSEFEQKLRKLFYHASLSLRYTEGTENKIYEDYRSVLNWTDDSNMPHYMKQGIQWNLDKYMGAKATSGGAIVKTILCIMNANMPKDFYTGQDVGVGLGIVNCDKHHIFPKAAYSSAGELIESVFNITFLTSESNNYIKDKRTSVYFGDLLSDCNIDKETGKAILKGHFIGDETFDAFMEERIKDFIMHRAVEIRNYLETDIGLKIVNVNEDQIENLVYEDLEDESDE